MPIKGTMARERRWLVIASDGRHVTLGRASDPSAEDLEQASEALRIQGLGGWLAVSEGQYYGRGKLELLMVRLLAEQSGATWEAALDAFHAARMNTLAQ
jgi:hypothetical protein